MVFRVCAAKNGRICVAIAVLRAWIQLGRGVSSGYLYLVLKLVNLVLVFMPLNILVFEQGFSILKFLTL